MTKPASLSIETDIEDVSLTVNKAIPLALIATELISNSLQHGFSETEGSDGVISLSLKSAGDCRYELVVSDNGKGIPETVESEDSESLGLELVRLLVEQLEGDMSIRTDGGTQITVWFQGDVAA